MLKCAIKFLSKKSSFNVQRINLCEVMLGSLLFFVINTTGSCKKDVPEEKPESRHRNDNDENSGYFYSIRNGGESCVTESVSSGVSRKKISKDSLQQRVEKLQNELNATKMELHTYKQRVDELNKLIKRPISENVSEEDSE